MKKRLGAATLLAAAALIGAGIAQGKELSAFKTCGPSGCISVTNRTLLRSLIHGVEAQGEAVRAPTPPPAPFLRLEFWVQGDLAAGPSFVQYYVPSRGLVALMTDPAAWTWVRPGILGALLDRVTTGVAPFEAPRISRVTIGGKSVRDPTSYVRLFRLQRKAESFPDEPDWQRIVIETAGPTPWSTRAATLEYSASTNVLWRGSQFVEVPSTLATRLEDRKSLAGGDESGFPWLRLAAGIGAASLIVPTALIFRRRRGS